MGKFILWPILLGVLILLCCSHPPTNPALLTILIPDDIVSLAPNERFETNNDSVLFNVFEPLVGLDKDLRLQPILAESWENPRPEEWRFHLRKNVYFHDGTPFTAREARQTLEDIRGSSNWQTTNFLNSVETISDLDPYTLAIVTKKPTAILSKLPFLYITKKSGKKFPPFLGTGPYQLVQWKPKQSITLESWDRYWGPLAKIHQVRFIPVEDPDMRFRYLLEGKTDIIYSPPMQKLHQPNPDIRVFRRPGITVYYISFGFRNHENPFANLLVRKAVHYALDREELVKGALHGNGAIPTQPIAPLVFGFNPDIEPPKYDLNQAKKLLAEAGFPSGFQTQLDFSSARLVAAQFIQKSLSQIGIQVTLNNVPSVYDYFRTKTSDFFIAGWDCASGDASEFYEFNLHTPTATFGKGNYGGYSNPKFDEIAETNTTIMDERERREMLQQADAMVMQELPVIPLYMEDDVYAARKNILFDPRADSEIKAYDVRYVKD